MSFSEHDTPALDPEALEELRACDEGGDGSLVAELIDLYLDDTPRRLAQLRVAVEADDAAAAAQGAHALKGSCSQFGATSLTELCRELEMLGRQGGLRGGDELLERIEREFERVKLAMELLRAR